ncbi:HAD family phosphatase [Clostridium sp. SM-530-WT-3G]|uniref:HAD family hydrolase n=1 Tax=Clostridium sp. SM-530-WT-3G TaxID=2725303 RepID=UPI00145D30CC|nr:HAD family phosphatase [Clostridium sp. SM-530-WT-3G]NME84244.1 HAD family phosphatase [Clostridium sp. SM-530-WT-3G]
MNKIKAVLFDMDGVIFDTEKAYLDTWIKVFNKHGYEMKREIYISVMGTGRKNVKKTFINIFGENLPIEEMYKEKDDLLAKIIDEGKVPVKDGAEEILSYLKENGYKVALATSAKRVRADKQVNMAKLDKYFDEIVTGDDISNGKPDPEIFLKAADKLGVKPEECIVVEDSPAGIQAAFNGCMYGIHVEDLKEADDIIKKYCYKNYKNLHQIKEYIETL